MRLIPLLRFFLAREALIFQGREKEENSRVLPAEKNKISRNFVLKMEWKVYHFYRCTDWQTFTCSFFTQEQQKQHCSFQDPEAADAGPVRRDEGDRSKSLFFSPKRRGGRGSTVERGRGAIYISQLFANNEQQQPKSRRNCFFRSFIKRRRKKRLYLRNNNIVILLLKGNRCESVGGNH